MPGAGGSPLLKLVVPRLALYRFRKELQQLDQAGEVDGAAGADVLHPAGRGFTGTSFE